MPQDPEIKIQLFALYENSEMLCEISDKCSIHDE